MAPLRAGSVLHVLWSVEMGGAERAVYQLATHQRRSGREVAIGVARAGGHFADLARAEGVEIVDFGMSSARDASALPRAWAAMRRFDVHHFHSAEPLLMVASTLCPGATRVYTHRGGVFDYPIRRRLRYMVTRRLLARFDTVTGSPQAAAGLQSATGFPARAVVSTVNGVDLDAIGPVSARVVARLRRQAGGSFVVGTAANLRRLKRVDWLIEAAAMSRDLDLEVWILGDGEDRPRLEALARGTETVERIRFCGPQSNIRDWLEAMDVFVMPSGPEESFGNAVVEAMACGVPTVVAADCPAHLEHLTDRVTGFVVRDPADLADRLAELAGDSGLRRTIGAAGSEAARRKYSMAAMVRAFDRVYSGSARPAG